ncbi:hypothetical protein [Bacillus massiliglaciei]|uniref:hypothetical protein n=1 Tax=Bacillus massiliglaciei TaxID=1816693 RepID=UPI000DA60894|nr:hypothetical protein [Bacillus massiliglaciei]
MMSIIIGCSNGADIDNESSKKVNDSEAKSQIKKYKAMQYAVENPKNLPSESDYEEKAKKYLSKELMEEHRKNRVFSIVPDTAKRTNYSMSLDKITFDKKTENADGLVDYRYTMSILFSDETTSKGVKKSGELTIKKNEDGRLVITRDFERRDSKIDDEMF